MTISIRTVLKVEKQCSECKELQRLRLENAELRRKLNEHNTRGAGRKSKPKEEVKVQAEAVKALLEQGYKGDDICKELCISRTTLYRWKKLLKEG